MPPPEATSSAHSSRASSIRTESHYLRPEDAFYASSPPRRRSTITQNHNPTHRARRSRRKTAWKKLLWVKQAYPDNYTDEDTFLDHLQRNPRLRPYEFWPLVADSTIIVQHVCSVVVFVCCFTGIYQERVGPQTVVGWATLGTVAGWVVLDYWQTCEEAEERLKQKSSEQDSSPEGNSASFGLPFREQTGPYAVASPHSRNPSMNSTTSTLLSPLTPVDSSVSLSYPSSPTVEPAPTTTRMQQRLATIKSAILIYTSLLGLSPILKSLTKSTSSDSIWALSSWLMLLNILTFDYGAGPEAKFPAPLSTNAALMASTVLASRMETTGHVFSLTLFSIEVFGLFPVFRRHLRHHSWTGHLWLTTFLVVLASGGLSMTISGGGYIMGIVGVILGGIITGLSMGVTSWWLIGLQRYKNEIRGPWDPARPVIGRRWD